MTPFTPYHAKYYACGLTCGASSGMDRLPAALFDAAVDLNAHQIEAALFALHSPLSKGVILADEVGLRKTDEAGIVLFQNWAERRLDSYIVSNTPSHVMRKQWGIEKRIGRCHRYGQRHDVVVINFLNERNAHSVPRRGQVHLRGRDAGRLTSRG